jgi:hypothetical protein
MTRSQLRLFKARSHSEAAMTRSTLARSEVELDLVDLYLNTLREKGRMRATLTAMDLLAGNLGPWS